MSGTNKKVV